MLPELIQYAERTGLTVQPGLKPKTVRWLLSFNPQGDFLGVQDLTGGEKKSKGRMFPACPDLTQQEMISAGPGTRHFLVDGVDVVALLTKDVEVDDKLLAKHDSFVGHLERASAEVQSLVPLATGMQREANLQAMREKLIEYKAKPTEAATLAIESVETDPPLIPVEESDWLPWWRAYREGLAANRAAKAAPAGKKKGAAVIAPLQMRCLLSGELTEPQLTHNKIEGLSSVGGLSMGDTLTSFDKDAFCSYGLSQGANAAMSEAMVKAYTAALNDLIRHHSRSPLVGVKIVHWYSRAVKPEDDLIEGTKRGFDMGEAVADDADEEDSDAPSLREQLQGENKARRLLEAIRSGERKHDLADCRFFVITLSANSGRVVIRDWIEGQFEDLAQAVARWFDDLSIVSRDGKSIIASHKFAAVLAAAVRDLKEVRSPLTVALWRAALLGEPIPAPLAAQTLARIKIDLIQDDAPRHARFGLLKAFCNRNERLPNMTAELNEHEGDTAYLCGRIMAILAQIQGEAMKGVNVGIVQRYYAAASATPALVLGRLMRTAQVAYLPKVKKGLRTMFEKQLEDVWTQLRQVPPTTLSLEKQTLFAMGYYQQQAKRWSSAKTTSSDESPEQETA